MELPQWLIPTKKISEKRKLELDRMCSSWATLAPHVTQLSRDECLYIMGKELRERNPPRPEFINRPFFRAFRLDRETMWAELQKIAPGCGYRSRHGTKSRA